MLSPQYLARRRNWALPATVYRLFDAGGVLLYVGVSLNPFARFAAHRSERSWFFDVASVTFEHFDSRVEALEAEARAIRDEGPKYNLHVASSRSLANDRAEAAWRKAQEAAA